jgi:hypothetical protein
LQEEERREYERELRTLSWGPPGRVGLLATLVLPRYTLRSLARRIERTADALGAIDPPAECVDAHEELRTGFVQLALEMSALARDRSLTSWRRWQILGASPVVRRLNAAGDALRAKGIGVER